MKDEKYDPYTFSETAIKEPPTGFIKSLKYLGPGLVLSASIVGSGELIATTALGAQAGFITLWVIIVSCFVKVALQLEFGITVGFNYDRKEAKTHGEASKVKKLWVGKEFFDGCNWIIVDDVGTTAA
mgnify:CR=1 FL=1